MEKREISVLIGERLRMFRVDRGLSLETLASVTGVSKPMLGQIERGVSNPTVATLWKIASGLGVPFTAFIAEGPQVTVARADEMTPLFDDGERYQVFNTYTSTNGNVEVYRLRLLPGCRRFSEPHSRGVIESLTVSVGTLKIVLSDTVHTLFPGDALSFPGDMEHEYVNDHDEAAEAHLVIIYA
ncbi:helix-turn-helix domain-containing protein [Alicyclobacillus mengziensis]|uniref:Helix-turn-helix transcriptional regulator n=1 Tax=Alicyclobacillus mengziensis TaxID=2931921 RepID=A0A9X7VY73_9BACL|nr:XRE family transcriptional regulator [Alicyclobacillus mengziensis]QSO46785.1 helix-turn-helix transcriptional regulator [Alicyclobacillus mengziensis]